MAIGTKSDFKIYNDQFNGGIVEQLTQFSSAFNAASRNTLRLITNTVRGDYVYNSFFQLTEDLISRRDPTSTSSVTAKKVTQEEFIDVKLNKRVGPVDQTLDAFKKIGRPGASDQELSFLLGQEVAKAMEVNEVNTILTATTAAIGTQPDLLYTVPSSGTLTTDALVNGLAKMGDASARIDCWIMHSKAYYNLVSQQITANIDGLSNFNVATGTPVTLNRPVIIIDSPALKTNTGGSPDFDEYYTLGLTANAGVVTQDTDPVTIHNEFITGLENLVIRMQAEYAYNIGVKGFKWDVQNGGANPTDTAIGTGSNWDKVMYSIKDLAGVRIKSR